MRRDPVEWDIPLWLGFLIAIGDMIVAVIVTYFFATQRAKRLVIGELTNPILGEKVRPAWGIPSIRHVKSIQKEIVKTRVSLKRAVKEASQKVDVHIDAGTAEDITKSLVARLRPVLKKELEESFTEARAEMKEALKHPDSVSPEVMEEEMMLSELLEELVEEFPEREKMLRAAAVYGRRAFKMYVMSRYPDEYLAMTGAAGVG